MHLGPAQKTDAPTVISLFYVGENTRPVLAPEVDGLKPGPDVVQKGEGVVSHWHLMEKGPSPIKVPVLRSWLLRYPDQQAVKYLLDGFSNGFEIPSPPPLHPYWSKNLPLVFRKEEVVRAKLEKEVKAGRVLEKTPGQYRLIHHLSYPKGDLVNDGIPLTCVLLNIPL